MAIHYQTCSGMSVILRGQIQHDMQMVMFLGITSKFRLNLA